MWMRWAVLGCVLLGACGVHVKPEAPKTTGTGPLDRVVLLPLTQRDVSGLLGHALSGDASPRRSRPVLVGEPRITETLQHVTVVREASVGASVALGYGPVGANASLAGTTHMAYDTTITGYAEPDADAVYRAESDCCFNGEPYEGCRHGYVSRVVRGTGSIRYLQESSSEAGIEAADVFEARDGSRYRVLETYTFEDAYFAFEVGDPAELCRLYGDEATFEAMEIRPNANCRIMAHNVDGRAQSHALYLMNSTDCRVVAADFCSRVGHCIRCAGRFDNGDEQVQFTLPHVSSDRVRSAEEAARDAEVESTAVTVETGSGAPPQPAAAVPAPEPAQPSALAR